MMNFLKASISGLFIIMQNTIITVILDGLIVPQLSQQKKQAKMANYLKRQIYF